MPSALVLNDSYRIGVAVIRSLGQGGFRVTEVNLVGLTKGWFRLVHSRWSERSLVLPRLETLSEEDLAEAVVAELRSRRYDVIVPVGYSATRFCSKWKDKLSVHSKVPVGGFDTVGAVSDKRAIGQVAKQAGLRTPTTAVLHSIRDWDRSIAPPLVIKPAVEKSSFKVRYFGDIGEASGFVQRWFASSRVPLVVQQRITGPGCGFFALYQRGRAVATFQHLRRREFPASGGSSSFAESIHDPSLERVGRQLLDHLRWHGIAMVEFKKTNSDGNYYLMEVNAKFWGSLELALACGYDFPLWLCQQEMGVELTIPRPYPVGRRYQWVLPEDLGHLLTSKRPIQALAAIVETAADPDTLKNFRFDDPGPNLYLMGSALRLLRAR